MYLIYLVKCILLISSQISKLFRKFRGRVPVVGILFVSKSEIQNDGANKISVYQSTKTRLCVGIVSPYHTSFYLNYFRWSPVSNRNRDVSRSLFVLYSRYLDHVKWLAFISFTSTNLTRSPPSPYTITLTVWASSICVCVLYQCLFRANSFFRPKYT